MQQRRALMLTGLIWCAIIFGIILFKQYTLWTGQEVLLRAMSTGVVRGPLRPHLRFRYDVASVVPRRLGERVALHKHGDIVYVTLSEKNGYAVISGLYHEPPQGKLFLKGEVRIVGDDTLHITYRGIEDYYLGSDASDSHYSYGRPIDVRVVVDAFGDATIKSITPMSAG